METGKKRGYNASKGRLRMKGGGMVPSLPKRQRFVDGGTVHALGGSTLTTDTSANPATGIIGTVNDLLGLTDKFNAGSAQITAGTNLDQLNQSYQSAIDSLAQATDFTKTVLPGVAGATAAQGQVLQNELGIANGTGPNPALAQLHQQTANNIATQGALQAGQRGANQNVGLIARNIAQQGGQIQQQAVGQEATTQAAQQLGANQVAANVAGQQVGQGQNAVSGLNSVQQGEQGILQNANTAANNAAVNMQSNINSTNASTAMANQDMAGKMFGALTGAGSSLGGGIGKAFSGASAGLGLARGGNVCEGPHKSHVANYLEKGGKVAAMVSPGEVYLTPEQVSRVVQDGENPMKIGMKIQGKAKKKNDSYDNDTVPANLDEGGVVIPRHITTHKMAPEKAELFVHRAVARKKAGRK